MKLDLFIEENPDPYLLPDDGVMNIINFSGGRSSAYMFAHFLYRYEGRLPSNTHVIFTNTGVEREETLVFVDECSRRWGTPVIWLEYRHYPDAAGGREDLKHQHAVVDFATASRDHEPYEAMIKAKAMLPNIAQRFCTSQLKVEPVNWYIRRQMGYEGRFRNILGIRYDEPKRWKKAIYEECWAEYPMVHAGVLKREVLEFWDKQPFDLGIDGDKGNIEKGTEVFTDDFSSYRGLPQHTAVNHSVGEYVDGQAHTQGIESFWSMLKRGYHGTYHKMSAEHLDRYVREFSGRHNIREDDTLIQMVAITRGLVGKRLRYRDLVVQSPPKQEGLSDVF